MRTVLKTAHQRRGSVKKVNQLSGRNTNVKIVGPRAKGGR